MGLLQPGHLILLLVIALVIVGPGKIAGLGGALGTSIRDFRKGIESDPEPPTTAAPAATSMPVAPLASTAPAAHAASADVEVEEAHARTKDA